MAVSDNIIVMNNAEIAQIGTPDDLYEAPLSAFIADFIGDANLVPCEVEASSDKLATAILNGQTLNVPNSGIPKGTAQMVLRPHALSLTAAGMPGLEGQISYAAYLGKEMQYTVDTPVGSLFIITPVQANPFRQGDSVSVGIIEEQARLVSA